jgi:hypothetical protein
MCNVSCLASGNLARLLLQGAQLATAGKMPRFVPVGKGTDQAQKYKKKQMICKTKYKKYEYEIRTIG